MQSSVTVFGWKSWISRPMRWECYNCWWTTLWVSHCFAVHATMLHHQLPQYHYHLKWAAHTHINSSNHDHMCTKTKGKVVPLRVKSFGSTHWQDLRHLPRQCGCLSDSKTIKFGFPSKALPNTLHQRHPTTFGIRDASFVFRVARSMLALLKERSRVVKVTLVLKAMQSAWHPLQQINLISFKN